MANSLPRVVTMRVLVGLLLLAVLAPLGAWYALPWWLPALAADLAPRYGVRLDRLEVERPWVDGVRVPALAGAWSDPQSGARAAFEIDGLLLGWTPAVAWRERRLDWAGVERLRLDLVLPTGTAEPAGIDLRVPSAPFDAMPVAAWRIDELEARWTQGADVLTATGAMEGRGRDLLGAVRVRRGDEEALRVSVGGRAGHEHRLTLSAPLDGTDTELLRFRENRGAEPGESISTRGRASADLDALSRVLPGLATPLQDLPRTAGRVELEWTGSVPALVNPDTPWAGIDLQGAVRVTAQADAIDGLPLSALHLRGQADFRLTDGKLQWTVADDLAIALRAPQLDTWARENLGLRGQSALRILAGKPLTGQVDLARREVSALDGALDVEGVSGNRKWLRQKIAIRDGLVKLGDTVEGSAGLELSGILHAGNAPSPLRQLEWRSRGAVSLGADILTYAPAGETRVHGLVARDGKRTAPLGAKLRFGRPLRVTLASGRAEMKDVRADLVVDWRDWVDGELPDFRHGAVQASFREVLLENNQQRVKGSWRVEGLEARSGEAGFGPLLAKGDLEVEGNTVRVHAQLETERSAVMLMQGNLTYDLARETATVEVDSARFGFPAATAHLKEVLRPWPAELVLNGGSVAGQVRARGLPDAVSGQGRIDVERLLGAWGEMPFSGLSVKLPFGLEREDLAAGPVEIHLRETNPGVPIRNVRMRITARGALDGALPPLEITDFSAQLLGGRVHAARFVLDPAAAANRVDLQVEGIVLSELLQLEQQQDLAGSGLLDGTLPVVIGKDGVSVAKGALRARDPGGFLRYRASVAARNLARTNPGVRIALDALQNFHYHLLRADVDYAPDGRLVLGLQIHGRNPDLKDGHPVHLNVNVEENVLTLLRSLQVSDSVSDRVGKSIQKRRSP